MQDFVDQERIKYNLKGLIVSINKDIKTSGNSMTTEPVNKDMLYRTGGQTIPMFTTLFLILVDQGYFELTDKIGTFLPQTPNGELITLQMLCDMTAGLPDIINEPIMVNDKDVFRNWTTRELLDIVYRLTPLYPPGQQFFFGHITNMLLLCKAIEIRMGQCIKVLLNKFIINKLKLKNTYILDQITPNNVLHSFNNLRVPEYEDSTYWSASWTSYLGKVVTNAHDLSIIIENICLGTLISKELHDVQISNPLNNDNPVFYGLGLVIDKEKNMYWSNANFNGYLGIFAYIMDSNTTICVQTNTDNNNGFGTRQIVDDFLNFFNEHSFRCFDNTFFSQVLKEESL